MPGLFKIMQTLILLGLVIAKCTWTSEAHKYKKCFSTEKLEHRALKILQRNRYQTDVHIDETQYHKLGMKKTCPTVLRSQSVDYNNRSVSPWRYSIDSVEGRFPEKIVVAECLCEGCLIIKGPGHHGAQHHAYNSVPIEQTQMVLMKTVCLNNPEKYSLTSHFVKVPIACTCVRSRI
ncbi:interleukin-17C-like [Oncorhynchus tshawytscha]|uniref:Interleukin-17C-like n=2 Tax=Oncorhynchus TaxID=8016 RepID=A0A8C7LKT4_ONCKI|nr:interleukin-17C-like [Oncorhynchus kisutch]XP_024236086.1 interleukin-17C-like [Oncorhynchus tshawytscha]